MSKNSEIKLSRNEESSMIYDLDFYWIETDHKAYTIGCVPVHSRLAKIRGKKDTFYTLMVDKNGYKVYRKTHSLKAAEWSLAHAPYYDHFQETFNALKVNNNNQRKGVMNLSTNKKDNKRNKKDKVTNDPILKIIYGLDLKQKDNDDETAYRAKMSLASVRPKDFNVIILPENMPEY